jgi:hypothetical protein
MDNPTPRHHGDSRCTRWNSQQFPFTLLNHVLMSSGSINISKKNDEIFLSIFPKRSRCRINSQIRATIRSPQDRIPNRVQSALFPCRRPEIATSSQVPRPRRLPSAMSQPHDYDHLVRAPAPSPLPSRSASVEFLDPSTFPIPDCPGVR